MITKIENLIKKNKFINKSYTFIGSMIVKFIGLFIKKEKDMILFVSFMGKNYNDSPKDIFEYMVNNPKYNNYNYVWAFTNPGKYNIDGITIVKMDSLKYLITALKAEYWVTNVNIERGLHFKKKYTKYINTWHGVPLKKVGNDVEGRNDFNFTNVDLFCYSSEYERKIYQSAFRLTDNNLFKFGMPRNDLVLENSKHVIKDVKKSLKIENKKIILYAPTWRDDVEDIEQINVELWRKSLGDDYILLVKAHGLSPQTFNVNSSFVIDVTEYEDTNKLIVASDILITDFSSIIFDFSILKKPIYILAKDYEKYNKERGLYFDLLDYGMTIYENNEDLLKEIIDIDITKQSIISEAIGKKFIEVREPYSTQKVVKQIFE